MKDIKRYHIVTFNKTVGKELYLNFSSRGGKISLKYFSQSSPFVLFFLLFSLIVYIRCTLRYMMTTINSDILQTSRTHYVVKKKSSRLLTKSRATVPRESQREGGEERAKRTREN